MKSAELAVIAQRWLDSDESELQLLIDQTPLHLQRRDVGVLCMTLLGVSWRGDDQDLAAALRLSGPSLGRFSAALALDPTTRRLCLLQYLPIEDIPALIGAIESLANQRDVWESMLSRRADTPRQISQPPSLGISHV